MADVVVKEKKHKCPFEGCKAAFSKPSRLLVHERFHKDERPFMCEYSDCEKSYTCRSHLKRHMDTGHAKTKEFECPTCLIKLASAANLKKHREKLHGEKSAKYKCNDCSQSFYKKHQLNEHTMYYHDGVVAYKCSVCSLGFVRERDLKQHLHKHGRYTCHCGKIFDKWTEILAHKRAEHKIKFTCDICNKAFGFKCRLIEHKLTHSDEKDAYVCPETGCKRMYLHKRNLTQHIKVAHKKELFKCIRCGKMLSARQKLKEHIQKMHLRLQPKTVTIRTKRAKRKDAGTQKRSAIVKLSGLQGQIPIRLEKKIIAGEKLDLENLIEIPVLSETESVKSDRSKSDTGESGNVRPIGV